MNSDFYEYDIIIIGGGAAGLVAAVCCAKKLYGKSDARIAVVEKEFKVGKKLLATGNGKCNMTNENMSVDFYNKASRDFLGSILSKYSPDKIISFWNSIGLLCKADPFGRVYPYSGQASSVLDILLLNLKNYGADIFCETEITSIKPEKGKFRLHSKNKTFLSEKVILASGGKVQPNLGSSGSSYLFADMLGLKCTSLFPSLAPVLCSDKDLPMMKGVRVSASVSLEADGAVLLTEQGELQLNEKNISGICVFQLSRAVNEFFAKGEIDGRKYKHISINADLMPDHDIREVEKLLKRKIKLLPDLPVSELFTGIINKKAGMYLLKKHNITPSDRPIASLDDGETEILSQGVKSLGFIPSSPSGINSAQVTAGGISLEEIGKNMQSKKYKNLYIIGEALDVDGLCGGYNLHFAFASGIISGNDCADPYRKKR